MGNKAKIAPCTFQFFERLQQFEELSQQRRAELRDHILRGMSSDLEKKMASQYRLAHKHEEGLFDALQGQYYVLYMALLTGPQTWGGPVWRPTRSVLRPVYGPTDWPTNMGRACLTPCKVSITSCICPYCLAHKHEEGLFDAIQG